MGKFKIQTYIYLFLIITTASSCFKERIEIDLNEDNKKVAVSAWISNLDQPQFVKLNYTTNYLDSNTIDAIKGAEVKIENGIRNYILEEKEDGIYYLPIDWKAEIGKEHTLTINVEGEIYQAKSIMSPCPVLEDMSIMLDEDEDGNEIINVIFSFDETEGEGDGYFGRDYKKGSINKDSLINGSYLDDDFIDGFRFDSISFTENSFSIGDTAIVELYSIGKDASNFIEDIFNEKDRGSLFDPPPVNIRTNISNGAIGYFIIGGARREQIIIK